MGSHRLARASTNGPFTCNYSGLTGQGVASCLALLAPSLAPRTSVSIACGDVERMAALFRALGWPETPAFDKHHRTFQCTNGVVIGLYAAHHYERHFGLPSAGFRGVTLGVNLASFEECLQVYETVRGVPGVDLLGEPEQAFWGGGFSWRGPAGTCVGRRLGERRDHRRPRRPHLP